MTDARQDGQTSGRRTRPPGPAPAAWFTAPVVPADHLRRLRLLRLLDRGASSPIVVVSAPAGSGKTALVADWVDFRDLHDQTAWITLERDDEAFWSRLLDGLERLGVAVPARDVPAGTGVDRPLLTDLAGEIAKVGRPVTVVLDGYEMTATDVATHLDFLLRRSGGCLCVVLVSRVDPVLPLYRYRLEGTLTEIRTADLAFTDAEAERLLSDAHVLLTRESVRALNEHVQGWVAGVRYASKFLATSEDPDEAIAKVSGDSGDIREFLTGEVLAAQTPTNRSLLLSTSIPATIMPGLAEALGGRAASRKLSLLARANTFVEPVSGRPGSFRYHPLFRELLRSELSFEAPDEMERLQRVAAEWFAQQGHVAESVSHFAEISAWAEAAGTVVDQLAFAELLTGGANDTLATLLDPIPDELRDPAAAVVRAALALGHGDTERVVTELTLVPDVPRSARDGHGGALALAVAVLRTIRARGSDDPNEAFELAEEAEEALAARRGRKRADAEHEIAAIVLASKGISALRLGRLDEAHRLFTQGAESALPVGSEAFRVECQGYLALIACLRDELSTALLLADEANVTADEGGIGVRDRSAAAEVALAWVDLERYDLVGAARHLRLATLSDAFMGDRVPETMLGITRSRVQAARGDVKGAMSIVAKTSADMGGENDWLTAQLRLATAHLMIRTEDTAAAVLELDGLEQAHPAETALIVAKARLLEGDVDGSRRALPQALTQDAPRRIQVAAWLVEATCRLREGSSSQAREALGRSLRLAAPEGLRLPFHEASPEVTSLLSDDASRVPGSTLSLAGAEVASTGRCSTTSATATGSDDPPLFVQQLTEKELEVLGHLAERWANDEIAAAMFVSVNTIRTHVQSIHRKLGVSRRKAAVERARELDILPGGGRPEPSSPQ